MTIFMSYYGNIKPKDINIEKCVSISITRPIPLPVLRELVPSPKVFKSRSNPDEYTKLYYEQLSKLDPYIVLNSIYELVGNNAVLLCWDGPGKFCHRYLVAKWIYYHTGVVVQEL